MKMGLVDITSMYVWDTKLFILISKLKRFTTKIDYYSHFVERKSILIRKQWSSIYNFSHIYREMCIAQYTVQYREALISDLNEINIHSNYLYRIVWMKIHLAAHQHSPIRHYNWIFAIWSNKPQKEIKFQKKKIN